ncbi:protein, SNF2 family [Cooperia oncophora]
MHLQHTLFGYRQFSGERSPLPGSPLTSESEDEFDIEGHDVSQIENDVLTGMLGDGSRPSMNIDLFCEGKPRRKIKDAVSDEPGPFEYPSTLHEYEDDGRVSAKPGPFQDTHTLKEKVTAKTRRGRSESPENIDQVDDEPSRPDLSDSDDQSSSSIETSDEDAEYLPKGDELSTSGVESDGDGEYVPKTEERENEDDVAAKPMQDKDGTTIAPQLKQDEDDVTIVPTEPRQGHIAPINVQAASMNLMNQSLKQFKEIGDKLKVSRTVCDRLFKYQKEGVVWLSELHEEYVGGILADEMGLGKTVQVLAFLRAVDESQINDSYMNFKGLGPSIIVCPSTVLRQWLVEFRRWMPRCRVAILHAIGNHKGPRSALIRKMCVNRKGGSVLITTYSTFLKCQESILPMAWHYVILDEGHKIRNPTAQITVAVKKIHTPCRLILSGTPLQNTLAEICDTISPFILRRLKNNVQRTLELPDKNEKVLFCEITDDQRRLYRDYLASRECASIFKGRLDAFVGLVTLRKLCNHPDLVSGGPNRHHEFDEKEDKTKAYGYYRRSGKMRVLAKLLSMWSKQGGEKVLIFSQSREMLDIVERKLQNDNFTYLRMDGSTGIGRRMNLVDQFNQDPNIFVFLLTTRVGGLGINLTAANKVVIFDPDWNPSTDTQAKERAWRIGQVRPVTIYRLMLAGTIEEKVYHRQIFKQFLANRILKDPRQRQFFKTNDLHDLFSLSEVSKDCPTETGALFAGETDEIRKENFFDSQNRESDRAKSMSRRKQKHNNEKHDSENAAVISLSDDKKAELRERARLLARKLSRLQEGPKKSASTPESYGNDASKLPDNTAFIKQEDPTESPSIANREKMATDDRKDQGEPCPIARSSNGDVKEATIAKIEEEEHMARSPGIGEDQKKPLSSKKKKKKRKLWRVENVKPGPSEPKAESSKQSPKSAKSTIEKADDNYVLGCLLKSAGVRCALEHDDLVGEKPSDYLVENEAKAVANRAAKSICRREVRRLDYTRKGISKAKNQEVHLKDKNVVLTQRIRDYVVNCGGKVFSEIIYKKFKKECKEDWVQFRAILSKLLSFTTG